MKAESEENDIPWDKPETMTTEEVVADETAGAGRERR